MPFFKRNIDAPTGFAWDRVILLVGVLVIGYGSASVAFVSVPVETTQQSALN